MILHIVLYQPKPTATLDELLSLAKAIERACQEIPSVRQARVGKASDFGFRYKTWPYDQNMGFAAVFEVNDLVGLTEYLEHPAHKELADMFWKTCDNPIIVDVSASDAKAAGFAEAIGHKTD